MTTDDLPKSLIAIILTAIVTFFLELILGIPKEYEDDFCKVLIKQNEKDIIKAR